jgi:hypothetical protein
MRVLLRPNDLASLAPERLPSYRQERYRGDAMSIPLDAFDDAGQTLLRQLYAVLRELRRQLEPTGTAASLLALRQLIDAHHWPALIVALRRLAVRPDAGVDPLRAAQVLHDLRGGALQALVMQLQLVELDLLTADDVPWLWFLARDHLKIMRNGVAGIDPAGAARDEADRLHGANLIVEKWQGAAYGAPEARATVRVDSAFRGMIAERCLEFSALDRVLYNLVNNASRHAADGEVALALLPVPAGEPTELRIGVANRVTDEQRERLHRMVGGDISRLFGGGLTTGGSGQGLRICAEFVQHAYGVPSLDAALAGGYLGIIEPDERFIVWVHWPIAGE